MYGVTISSSYDLLPHGTELLPEPVLTYHEWGTIYIQLRAISQEFPQASINEISWEITSLIKIL